MLAQLGPSLSAALQSSFLCWHLKSSGSARVCGVNMSQSTTLLNVARCSGIRTKPIPKILTHGSEIFDGFQRLLQEVRCQLPLCWSAIIVYVHVAVCVCVCMWLPRDHSDTHLAFNILCETRTDKQMARHTELSRHSPDGAIIVNLIELISTFW